MIQYGWRPGVLESLVPRHRVQLWHRYLGSTLVGTEDMDLLRLEVERELADGGNKFDHQTTKGDVLLQSVQIPV
jgi:hypothetical protein